MKYTKEERRAINEANRAVNEAARAAKKALKDADAAAFKRRQDAASAAYAKAKAEDARREAERAARRLSEAERIARAQQDWEARVDAFTDSLSLLLSQHELKLLGGWTKDEYRLVPPTYSGTVVELASTTSEHKAVIRVQIGQGLKR